MEKDTEAERKKLNELRMKTRRETGQGEVKLRWAMSGHTDVTAR